MPRKVVQRSKTFQILPFKTCVVLELFLLQVLWQVVPIFIDYDVPLPLQVEHFTCKLSNTVPLHLQVEHFTCKLSNTVPVGIVKEKCDKYFKINIFV